MEKEQKEVKNEIQGEKGMNEEVKGEVKRKIDEVEDNVKIKIVKVESKVQRKITKQRSKFKARSETSRRDLVILRANKTISSYAPEQN
ncbi:hypothetical protein AVEN_148139-1 [Araneus ventricosus]|uniref:Uncharacterized protein n=1 Tax=Araneus ventricosus TaxID=182803 RepID=A0A4Y2UH50_ARAVE|nr:hypothetical protein AVEN_148139-1 [Araneus ventricosus]